MNDAIAKETCDGATVSGAASGSPCRVQRSRKKGWRKPENTVCVSRPQPWGNPHTVGFCHVCGWEHTREEAIAEFRADILGDPLLIAMLRRDLAGKNLACWCPLDKPCHADVLLKLANA